MRGLIIENISNSYKVKNLENAEIFTATARGKFKKENVTPVVGDTVEFEILDKEKNEAVIEKIEERSVYVKRPKLANITQIIFVVSMKSPKPDLLMLDKQLAFAEFLGIKVVIVLNKTDLSDNKQYQDIKNIYEKIGYKVIVTIAKEKKGIDVLKKELKGNINAFSGNSGVGKSTLINAIFDSDVTKEGEISKKNKRGKNTTTAIKLYEIEENTYIADTPGFSTFEISEIEANKLQFYFREFKKYIENCEFIRMHTYKRRKLWSEKSCGRRKNRQNKI